MMKKLTFALVSAFVLVAFASCDKENDLVSAAKISVDPTTLTFDVSGGTKTVSLTATRDWTVSVNGAGVTVIPESGSGSNDSQTITINAEKNDGKTRTAVVTFSCGNNLEATVNVTVTGALGNQMAIEDIYKTTAGTVVETSGLVVGVSTRSFIISDETGYLMVYRGDDATEAGAQIGDEVTVEGPVALYGELIQIDEPTSCEVTASGQPVSYPETPTVIDADNISTFDITEVSYIQMSGIYASSPDSKDPNTIHHNIAIPGTSVKGSIAYPVADLGLDEMEGHEITVTGFFAGGNNEDYRNILAVDVEDNGEPQVENTTIDQVIAAETNSQVSTSGTVMAICQQGFIIADETGAIYIYEKKMPEVKIGNKVEVSGMKDVYNSGHQIASPTVTVTDSGETVPSYDNFTDLTTSEAFNAYSITKPELVKVTGVLDNGRYVDVDGGELRVSMTYTIDNYDALNGKTVTVLGYTANYLLDSKTKEPYAWAIVVVSVESEPYIEVNSKSVAASETSATIDVSSNVSWTVTKTDGDWVTLNTTSGSNDGTIELAFSANESSDARTATFKISGSGVEKTFTLTQGGVVSGAQETTLSFVGWEFDGASDWSSSYAQHTVEFDIATVDFEKANKQSSNITDCPVTKGQDIELKMKGTATISAVTFHLKQWTTKAQTASLFTSTDGGSTYSSDAIATSDDFTLKADALPTGTNAVKVTFSSSSNQVGLSSIDLTYKE